MADLTADALVSLADTKEYCKVLGADDDEIIKELINDVSVYVQLGYCHRTFRSVTYTDDLLDGSGLATLYLPQWPITTMTKLIPYRDGPELVEDTDYVAYKSKDFDHRVVLLNGTTFPREPQGVTVTYTAGYTVTSGIPAIPDDLKFAVMKAVMFELKKRQSKAIGVVSQGLGTEQSVEYISAPYPKEVTRIWDQYRRWA